MSSVKFTLNKLIRDGIPAICQADGITLELQTLAGDQLNAALKDKLVEEAREAQTAPTPDKTREELADLLEVIHALCQQLGISLTDIENIRQAKRRKRGGFDGGIFNTTATMAADNPARKFYEK
jgi:predicted house-cleaning noncanonical NTP pyrophosphatase (MazG superfamily)